MRRKKDQIVTQEGNQSYWKKFYGKSDKKQKIFFCTPIAKLQKISILNICNKAKQIYPKKQKKKLLRKDTLRVSEAVIQRSCVKKVSLKILPPVYLHIIEIDIR